MASRRQFIKWSLSSAVALSAGVAGLQWLQEEDFSQLTQLSDDQFQFLTAEDRLVLITIIPAVLGENYLKQWQKNNISLTRLLPLIDQSIRYLPQHTQKELRQLFSLLWNRLGKLLLVGIWSSWSNASLEQLNTFLFEWRNSWLTLLNQSYLGLQQLIVAAYFSQPDSWEQCGYPGPPF